MKLLITGGCGFIGSNFIKYILSKYDDCEIVNFDKLTYAGNPENLKDVENDKRYSFIKGDICDAKAVEKAVCGVDAIINFAAETHVDRSIVSAGSFINTDVYGTYILLEAVKTHNIKRFIQISTDEIYGSIEAGSFKEQSPTNPNSPYAASKAGGDLIVKAYRKTYNLPVIITRSSNNFGSFQYPEKFIPLFITNALSKEKLPLYGDGKNIRDWIFVEDNCEAIDIVLRKGKDGEVYNIGGENEKQNIEIVKLILKKLDISEDVLEYVKDRPGHDRRYSLDCSKIKKELGWAPKHDFKEALEKTVEWYINNSKWWKKIKDKQKEFKEFYSTWYLKR
ncbi:MAG: dTDP-glucose 4 6-dehydratase [Candidatus Saganbacteria bacterium]|uniref:dTDP-glucose 4,6-dehydratase n=1 Tax=Candidatus Saganbacteria bacterium TaxID=2575572 RepID=A0A833L2P3_UNCSA|nr:MAG: dTDP-glucose 4 6-dehydratase [Candidatus Saganbacteria bacterium]